LPLNTAAPDFYGGHRLGDGLFGESLVCLDVETGRRVWHYQFVHHGLWDYDPPAAPNLIDVTVNGARVKAVEQVTKQGFVFTFDRVTGKPIWTNEERPVAPSDAWGAGVAHAAVSRPSLHHSSIKASRKTICRFHARGESAQRSRISG
jgi:quinoprotein glucose dehydrogenase